MTKPSAPFIEHATLDADSHNFGKKTVFKEDRILKPRNLLAEFVVFGETSPIRVLINNIYQDIFHSGELLPALKFFSPVTGGPSLEISEMEKLVLSPVNSPFEDTHYFKVGAFLAFSHFFGLTDSHRTNVMIGNKGTDFFFVSVDCETLLTKLPHAVSLGLFCHESKCPCQSKYCFNYGLSVIRDLREFTDESMPAKVIHAYLAMLRNFQKHSESIELTLNTFLIGKKLPKRQIFNYTYEYAKAIKEQNFTGFSPEEVLQMERGDIPYFFQIHGTKEVFFWVDEKNYDEFSHSSEKAIFESLDNFILDEEIIKQIICHTAQTLDFNTEKIYKSEFKDIIIYFKKEVLVIMQGNLFYTAGRLKE